MPGSDTPHLHQTVTNPSQAGWNGLGVGKVSKTYPLVISIFTGLPLDR